MTSHECSASGEGHETPQVPEYPLNQIYFYLTEGCNLKCRHCWLAPKYQCPDTPAPALDPALFQLIIEQAKPMGLGGVKLTGGEPLLHPQIDELLDIIHAKGLRLTVETNGVLCTPELAGKMATCKNAFVSVSVDGADAETHEWVRGVKGCFDAAVDGIRNLVNAGLKPQVIMSLMRHNQGQLEELVRMAESLGAGSVKFNIVQPTARGTILHETGQTLTIEELVDLGEWVETTLSTQTKISLQYSHPPAFRPMGRMFGEKRDSCCLCGILGIIGVLHDGTYALCGIGETVPEMTFGQAGKDHLADVWESPQLLRELREGLPERLDGICSDCLMKGFCRGNCIAQNYYTSKNLWAPFWYCQKAQEAGRFPETRVRPD